MSIQWMSVEDLGARLIHDHPPTGLILHPLLHVRMSTQGDVLRWTGHAPQVGTWLPGLDLADAWAGIYKEMPFSIVGAPNEDHYGITVSMPIKITSEGILDLGFLEIFYLMPRRFWNDDVYFETLPFEGAGYGLFWTHDIDRENPIFRSSRRDDAQKVFDLLVGRGEPDRFYVGTTPPAQQATWVVTGPKSGPYVSYVEVLKSRQEAERFAQKLSSRTMSMFVVYEGQIGMNVACAFEGGTKLA